MLTSLIDGLLPGARNLRPPLISGLLWALLLWILFADRIPEAEAASGWAAQVYQLGTAAGPIAISIVLSILVFVVGSTLSGLAEALSAAIGRITLTLQRAIQWQRHARQARRELRRQAASLASQRQTADQAVATAGPTPNVTSEPRLAMSLRQRHEQVLSHVASVDTGRWKRLYIPDSAETRQALGNPPARAQEGLEGELVEIAWRQGLIAGEEEQNESVSQDDLFTYSSGMTPDDREFQAELGTDPLDVIRALNESLYMELDRERAERDVRLAMATPVLAFGVYAAVTWSSWWLVFCALPLSFIVRYSFAASQERTRVLQLLRLHNLRTPALQEAYDSGRARVRSVLRRKRAEEEAKRREREALTGQARQAALES